MSNVIEVVSESLTVEVTQGTSTTVGLAAPVGPQGPPGTTDFTQLQNVPSTFPPSSHTHASSEITDFNSAASSAAPVQSVAGRTGAVTLAVADVANAVSTSDARLSDPRSPTSHKSTHAIGGSDALSPADIGAATSAQGALADSAVQPSDLATVATSGSFLDLDDIPSTFNPSAHTHTLADITDAGTAAASDTTDFASATHTHANATTSAAGFLSTADKTKLDGIEAGAQVNTVTSVAGKTGAVSLAKADVGLGNVDNTLDLNKPISTATQAALNLKADATALSSHVGDTANPHSVTKAQVGLGNVDNTSDLNKPISAATQAALDGKQAAGSYATLVNGLVPSAQLPSFVDDVLEFANLAALPVSGETGKIYVTLDTNKTYRWSGSAYVEISPSPGSTDAVPEGSTNLYFTNARASAAAPVQSVAGKTGAVTLAKGDVGLGNVDNTSDLNKPVSTATQSVLDGKVDKITGKGLSTEDFTSSEKTKLAGIEAGAQVNVVTSVAGKTGAVTLAKGDVGLGNVDNTSDLNKPISTAAQTALDGKAATVHTHTAAQVTDFNSAAASAAPVQSVAGKTGTVTLAKGDVGLSNVDNTSDLNKPISTATQTALGNKAVKLEITAASTPSASPFQLNLQINKFYNVFKDTADDCNLLLPTSASDGDVIVVRRLGGSSGGVLNVVRQGGTPFLQTIGQIGSSGQIFRAIWLGGWNAENPSVHAHSISEVTGLQAALDGKQAAGSYAAAVHTHVAANVTDFNSAAASAAPVQSVAGKTGTVILGKADVGLSNVDNTSDASKPVSMATQTALDGKVDKITGKGLSTEDFTSAEKTKLAGIAAGAEVNVNADWTATTGDAAILNKPTTFTPSAHTHVAADVVDLNAASAGSLYDGALSQVGALVQDGNLRLVNGDGFEAVLGYESLTATRFITVPNANGTISLDGHTHVAADVTDFNSAASAAAPVQSVAGKTGAVSLTKSDVGLGNVANTAQVTSVTGTAPIVSSGGTTPAISISAATTSAAGSMSAADKLKLDGIASGAEVNVNADWNATSGDAAILNKPTTFTPSSHTHGNISNAGAIGTTSGVPIITGASGVLQAGSFGTTAGTFCQGNDSRLSDARTPTAHTHPIADVTNLQTSLDSKAASVHTHAISDVTGLQTALDGKQVAGSYATLVNGLVPSNQLPSFVDDVLEFANFAALPGSGESGKIYTTIDNNKIYRWSGSAYVEISASPGSTDAVPEGSTNLYFTNARASAAAPVQSVAGRTGAVTLTKADVGLSNVANTAQVTSVTGTAPIVSSGGTTPAISISPATTSTAGSMSAADYLKLLTIQTGAEANVNADWNATTGDAAILNKPSTFPPSSHTHAASEVTSGTFDIARIPTGSSSTTVCIGNDARLSDARTPTSHVHGNITNAGAIGSTANLPVITTTSGVLTTGSFGTAANTFCQGNDSRLSDARTPTSHVHGNITNAGAIGSTSGVPIITGASGVLQAGSFGTTAGTFCQGNDARLSDARTPTSHTHADATSSVAGFMSSTDKSKLDGIAAGAEVNVNADWNAASGDAQILNKPSIPAASSATPLSLGTASAGTASTFSRSDHRHAMPSASDVGAAASVGASDIEITDATKGVILRAPDGGRWRLTIDSTGILNTTRL